MNATRIIRGNDVFSTEIDIFWCCFEKLLKAEATQKHTRQLGDLIGSVWNHGFT